MLNQTQRWPAASGRQDLHLRLVADLLVTRDDCVCLRVDGQLAVGCAGLLPAAGHSHGHVEWPCPQQEKQGQAGGGPVVAWQGPPLEDISPGHPLGAVVRKSTAVVSDLEQDRMGMTWSR